MTSNAKLVAFDDDKDKAILRYENGKIFSCPSDYVTVEVYETSGSDKSHSPESVCIALRHVIFFRALFLRS